MRTQLRTRRRHPAGFTLIELLVVIAILAVLFSLTSAAVMKIMDTGPRTQTKTEISQFETSHATFRAQFTGAKFIPSYIKLSPTNNYQNNALDNMSKQALVQIFGRRINLTPSGGTLVHDWSGSGSTSDFILQGPECLMFFLGGIPTAPGQAPGCLGFNADPSSSPAAPSTSRNGPYTTWCNAARMIRSPSPTATNFIVYLDPYRMTPYAYYSSYSAGNDYNTYSPGNNDCAWLSSGTNPLNQNLPYGPLQAYSTGTGTSAQYVNRDSYQIISAGKDGKFGPGGNGIWTSANGYGGAGPGADDQSNFSKGILAVGAN